MEPIKLLNCILKSVFLKISSYVVTTVSFEYAYNGTKYL